MLHVRYLLQVITPLYVETYSQVLSRNNEWFLGQLMSYGGMAHGYVNTAGWNFYCRSWASIKRVHVLDHQVSPKLKLLGNGPNNAYKLSNILSRLQPRLLHGVLRGDKYPYIVRNRMQRR